MNFSVLCSKISSISDREWLLYPAGIKERYHLGEQNVWGLHLIDATDEEVLQYVQNIGEVEKAQ